MDMILARRFIEPLTKCPWKGTRLAKVEFESLLKSFYKKRGEDNRACNKDSEALA